MAVALVELTGQRKVKTGEPQTKNNRAALGINTGKELGKAEPGATTGTHKDASQRESALLGTRV